MPKHNVYDDAGDLIELGDDFFANAKRGSELAKTNPLMAKLIKAQKDGTLTVNGRPPLDNPKQQVTVRLDAEIIEYFKQDGKGWQTRLNAALSEYVASH